MMGALPDNTHINMLLSLIVGIILGAVAVVFALQNVAEVAVTFASWQMTAPLAVVLLGTLLLGALITLLVLIPSLIRGEVFLKTIHREKREVEDEFAKYRTAHSTVVAPAPGTIVEERVVTTTEVA